MNNFEKSPPQFDRKKYKWIVVDGQGLFVQGLWGQEPIVTKDGLWTGGVWGISNYLRLLLHIVPGKWKLLWTWDSTSGGGKRVEIEPDYKIKRRTEKKDDWKIQGVPMNGKNWNTTIEAARSFISLTGTAQFFSKGWEGDDILATLVKRLNKRKDGRILVVSRDHDLFQTLGSNVDMLRLGGKVPEIWTKEYFLWKRTFPPKAYSDFLAIKGDPTDEIPGVKGIGDIWAQKIMSESRTASLKGVYETLDDDGFDGVIPERQIKLLTQGRSEAWRWREVSRLRKNLKLSMIEGKHSEHDLEIMLKTKPFMGSRKFLKNWQKRRKNFEKNICKKHKEKK